MILLCDISRSCEYSSLIGLVAFDDLRRTNVKQPPSSRRRTNVTTSTCAEVTGTQNHDQPHG